MGRFSWLKMCRRRYFLLSTATECNQLGNGSHLSAFRRALLHARALHGCSASIGKPIGVEIRNTLLRKRFIHATGSCFSNAQDYYEILGVSRSATPSEIKKAFHALAKKYHPDANKGNPSAKRKFQEIRDAYETLQDSERRAQYDKEHIRRPKNVEYDTGNGEGFRYAARSEFSNSFQKIFSELFENDTNSIGSDIQVELSLSFAEAVKGCTKHMSFDSSIPCGSCYGRGHHPYAKTELCYTCGGTGKVTIPPFTSTCSTCKGMGRIIKEYCRQCSGSGVVEGVKEVNVTIPAGVESGDTISIGKAGNAGRWGSKAGNLYIKLKVDEDSVFVRDGADIYVDANVTFTQAILGGNIKVPTLSGKMEIKIPKGVQHGQLLVLRGRGLPKHGFFVDHGDQYVRFRVNLPKELTERQREILEELAKEEINYGNKPSSVENWVQQIFQHMTGSRFMLEMSIFILILILLHKITG